MADMKKILFAGIDNAGKTSILHILKKNYSFLSKLKPTKGIERSSSKILDIDFVLWDMGGQKQYIEDYFGRKEYIFTELSVLFFVIDIQDEMRFDQVLEYLEKIVSVFREQQQTPEIVVFYHKVDPNIEHTTNVKLFTNDLTKKVQDITKGFSVTFFQTSIFKRWSIVAGFSYGIRAISKKDSTIKLSDYLIAWADYFGAKALLLISSDDVVINEYARDEKSATTLKQYLDELLKIYEVSHQPVVLHMGDDILTLDPLEVGKLSLYIVKYTNNPQITEAQFIQPIPLQEAAELEDLLLNFFQKI
ncbi:MAG: ADP-ribosylation factor-like protein [Candidatus Helarchaeota archaeon]